MVFSNRNMSHKTLKDRALVKNSNCKCDNSTTQIVAKPKLQENLKTKVLTKLKNSKYDKKEIKKKETENIKKPKFYKTPKLKWQHNST